MKHFPRSPPKKKKKSCGSVSGWPCGSFHMDPTQETLDVDIDTSDAPQFEGLDAVHISNGTTDPFEPDPVPWVSVLREPKRQS